MRFKRFLALEAASERWYIARNIGNEFHVSQPMAAQDVARQMVLVRVVNGRPEFIPDVDIDQKEAILAAYYGRFKMTHDPAHHSQDASGYESEYMDPTVMDPGWAKWARDRAAAQAKKPVDSSATWR